MFFNSIEYFIFFPIVLILYFCMPHKMQNRMLLAASYVFYGWWDYRFLSLILISTITDYYAGKKIYETTSTKSKKRYLIFSIIVNLTLLGFFKYWNFFIGSLSSSLSLAGIHLDYSTLNIILPVGISFYTFQTMTYSIDIYRGKLHPTSNFQDFALFVSYFPQLVAGPIERAERLLPQIVNKRKFDSAVFMRGLQLIFWGLFKKVFVADNLGILVNSIYGNPSSSGFEYMVATWAFAFQIFGDFSGYTDIARGTSKCLGIELMHNFKQPYFALNPSDFWRRWHISLSTWLRDYLYIPLGGNKSGKLGTYRNLMITMILGGLWHGAAWNFVLWGLYHGVLLCSFRPFTKYFNSIEKKGLSWQRIICILLMFNFTWIGWIFFRAQSFEQIIQIVTSFFHISRLGYFPSDLFIKVMFFSFIPLIVMAYNFTKETGFTAILEKIYYSLNRLVSLPMKSFTYGILAYLLCLYGAKAQSFIYFQF